METSLSRIAVIVIAGGKRTSLIDDVILPSIAPHAFADVLVVGEHHAGTGYRYLHVPDMMKNTNDALLKRDTGTLATNAEWLFYLCDDHAIASSDPHPYDDADVIIPTRVCIVGGRRIALNMGVDQSDPNAPYCGGHAGLFRRSLIQRKPWATMPHDRIWDVLASREQIAMGARFVSSGRWIVQDLEPENRPWQ